MTMKPNRQTGMNVAMASLAVILVIDGAASTAYAQQQTTRRPGSPSATTTIDGSYLRMRAYPDAIIDGTWKIPAVKVVK